MIENLRDKIIKRISNELWNLKKLDFKENLNSHRINSLSAYILSFFCFIPFAIFLNNLSHQILGNLLMLTFSFTSFLGYKKSIKEKYKNFKKSFLINYSIKNENIEQLLKNEFSDSIRLNALFTKEKAFNLFQKGILNLTEKEYDELLNSPLNDEQIRKVLNLMKNNKNLNIFTISDLVKIDQSNYIKNKLGIENKTLKSVLEENEMVVEF